MLLSNCLVIILTRLSSAISSQGGKWTVSMLETLGICHIQNIMILCFTGK